jgi:LPXTG-motif cell wall-anchored protein
MSQPKVIGSAAVATLPLTGNNAVTLVLAGIALVVVGLLLVRSGRYRNEPA